MAATRMNSAGNVVLRSAQLIVTEPSSSGWWRTSSVSSLVLERATLRIHVIHSPGLDTP
jgi:hypothetical protein